MKSATAIGLPITLIPLFALLQPAQAVNFLIVYDGTDPQGIDPCSPRAGSSACPGGESQTEAMLAVLRAAADHWSDVIEDDHSIILLASWLDPARGSLPEASIESTDSAGRTTVARVRVGPMLSYFYDPTPEEDNEFNMRPALYRTLHPAERLEAFSVQPAVSLQDALEVGCQGRFDNAFASPGVDLFTIALHELGHVMGLSRDRAQCNASEPFYITPPGQIVPQVIFDAYQFLDSEGEDSSDCNHLALGGIQACKTSPEQETLSSEPSTVAGLTVQECTAHQALMWPGFYPGGRSRPSAIDILAVAAAEGWQEIDFPRKYSLGSGLWQNAARWLGTRAPDADDEVFLASSTTTTTRVTSNQNARAATIAEGNILSIEGANLLLSRSLRATRIGDGNGPIAAVPAPNDGIGDIGVEVVPATVRLAGNAGVQAQTVINLGRIEGNGTVGVTHLLSNASTLRADGGRLRIVTPEGQGGIAAQTPVVDLDGPSPIADTARLLARDGNLDIDAILNGPFQGRVEVGPNRRIRFSDGFTQAFSSDPSKRVVIDGGTIAGACTFLGTVELEGLAELEGVAVLGPAARMLFEAAGQQPGVAADLLFVDGDIALNGSLMLELEAGYEPPLGAVLSLVRASGMIAGAFTSYALPDISRRGVSWNVVQTPQNLLLSVIFDPSQVMSDVNGDGLVNPLDLLALFFAWGPCPPQPAACPADLNGDDVVSSTDVSFWMAAN